MKFLWFVQLGLGKLCVMSKVTMIIFSMPSYSNVCVSEDVGVQLCMDISTILVLYTVWTTC